MAPLWILLIWGLSGCDEPAPPAYDIVPKDCENTLQTEFLLEPNEDTLVGELGGDGTNVFLREDLLPALLSETGLYSDIESKDIHGAIQAFTPQFELWSDGAEKARWVYLPECEVIDTRDMNNWELPVGTRLFKEFTVDGMRIETRIIQRIGEGPRDFAYGSYLWNEEETEATRVGEDGVLSARGTNHDIPGKLQCLRCHGSYAHGGGRPSRALGFSALQLSHSDTGLNLAQLEEDEKLSEPAADSLGIPGDAQTQQALGYLHANCGNCHNSTQDGVPQVNMNLWLDLDVSTLEESGAWQTAVDQPTRVFSDQHVTARIVSGNPDESALLYRMSQRGNNAQMPPLATHEVDEEGVDVIRQWIEGLP